MMHTMLFTASMVSPLGTLRLVASADALVGVYLPDHKGAPDLADLAAPVAHTHDLAARSHDQHPVLRAARQQLEDYFAGTRVSFSLPLGPAGTPFQRAVWQILAQVPFGHTWTYADIARQLGRPGASRAVGAANGRNPISIIVPCHRIVGSSGALTGYAGGLAAKQWLLAHESRVRASA